MLAKSNCDKFLFKNICYQYFTTFLKNICTLLNDWCYVQLSKKNNSGAYNVPPGTNLVKIATLLLTLK